MASVLFVPLVEDVVYVTVSSAAEANMLNEQARASVVKSFLIAIFVFRLQGASRRHPSIEHCQCDASELFDDECFIEISISKLVD